MRHAIYPERQGTPTSDSTDAAYPVTNLGNNYRKKVYKAVAAVQTSTVRQPISANASVIGLYNTNAGTAICTITLDSAEQTLNNAAAVDKAGTLVGVPLTGHGYVATDVIILNGTTNYDGVYTLGDQSAGGADEIVIDTGVAFIAETFAGTETACVVIESATHTVSNGRFWQEYTTQVAAHTATIKLTTTEATVEAGVLRAGALLTMTNPAYGISETLKDYSIKKELRNGAYYTRKLEMVRMLSWSCLMSREVAYRSIITLYEYYGPDPFAMLITDNISGGNDTWTVFGCFESIPNATHSTPDYSNVSIAVAETV